MLRDIAKKPTETIFLNTHIIPMKAGKKNRMLKQKTNNKM